MNRYRIMAYRDRLYVSGDQGRAPDAFDAEAHRQSAAVAHSPCASDDQAFIDAASVWGENG
ncbi:MAG TPA: antitoxin MazE-like protein [Azospirillum sp.]